MTNMTIGKHVLGTPAMGVIDHSKKDEKAVVDGNVQSHGGDDKSKAADDNGAGVQQGSDT